MSKQVDRAIDVKDVNEISGTAHGIPISTDDTIGDVQDIFINSHTSGDDGNQTQASHIQDIDKPNYLLKFGLLL